MSSIHRFRYQLQLWHLLPLAVLALIGVSLFVWIGRGQFAQQSVSITLEGPAQMEGGTRDEFLVRFTNNSDVVLEDVHIVVALPAEFSTSTGGRTLSFTTEEVDTNDSYTSEFDLIATSSQTQTSIEARADYSPRDLNARFITRTAHTVTIGSLDASVELELPEAMYPGEEIEGVIRVEPNTSFAHTILYARLIAPEGFELLEASPAFSNEGEKIWKLGTLAAGAQREVRFRGRYEGTDELVLEAHVGRYEGIRFLPLRVQEERIVVSSSPLLITMSPLPISDTQREEGEVPFEITLDATSEEALRGIEVLLSASNEEAILSSENSAASPPGPTLQWSDGSLSQLEELTPASRVRLSFILNVEEVDEGDSITLLAEARYEGASGSEAMSQTTYELQLEDVRIEEEE